MQDINPEIPKSEPKLSEPAPNTFAYLVVPAPGSISKEMTLGVGINRCGSIADGVSLEFSGYGAVPGSWCIAFADLERWYLANKYMREAAQLREAIAKRGEQETEE